MEQDVEVEWGLTMGIRALTITVQLECDDYAFSASRGRAKERGLCLGQVSITENTLRPPEQPPPPEDGGSRERPAVSVSVAHSATSGSSSWWALAF